jgi:hypothetical protein
MARLFQDNQIVNQLGNFIQDLRLVEDAFSLKRFENLTQSLKVFGSYALAAAVIPPVLATIINPLSYIMVAAGAIAICASFNNAEHQNELRSAGFALMVLSSSLAMLNQMIPFALAAVLIYRAIPLLADKYPVLNEVIPSAFRP